MILNHSRIDDFGNKFNLSSRSNVFITLAHDINQLSRLDEIPSNRSESDWMDWCQELAPF